MNRFTYTLLFYCGLPLILLRLLYRACRAPAYARRWYERFGFFKSLNLSQPTIWVHSVSVGETIAAAPLVRDLMARYPDHKLVVTTMTPTGSDRVKALYGDKVFHIYAPYDLPGAVRRFLTRIRPSLAVIMETEMWPNTIAGCAKMGVPTLLANARLSERSAKGYARFPRLVKPMLNQLSMVAVQNSDDGQRFIKLGLPENKLKVCGSIKFDMKVDENSRQAGKQLRQLWLQQLPANTPIWIAASTHKGEEEQVIDAFAQVKQSHPDLRLLLVPRHPERFSEVAALVQQRGFGLVRRSVEQALQPDEQVILGDTMGEMMTFLAASDLVFVGGSLVPTGGHNMLEPALYGLPIITGPHLFNFSDISQLLEQQHALLKVSDSADLAAAIDRLLVDSNQAQAMGAAGLNVVEKNRGALQRMIGCIDVLLSGHERD